LIFFEEKIIVIKIHAFHPILVPLALADKKDIIPLSRGDKFVTMGDIIVTNCVLELYIPLFKRPTKEGRTFGGFLS
jgi:hypothetical protein